MVEGVAAAAVAVASGVLPLNWPSVEYCARILSTKAFTSFSKSSFETSRSNGKLRTIFFCISLAFWFFFLSKVVRNFDELKQLILRIIHDSAYNIHLDF